MEYIKNIEIKNFKSIRHQVIDGCKRINVFIGYPNVGKSNILEAIGMFSTLQLGNESFKFSDICRVKHFSELFFNKDYKESAEVILNKGLNLRLTANNSNHLRLAIQSTKDENGDLVYRNILTANIDREFRISQDATINKDYRFLVGEVKKYTFLNNSIINLQQPSSLALPYGYNLLDILQQNSALRKELADIFEEYKLKLFIDGEEIKFLKYLPDGTGVSIPYHQVADTLRLLIFYKASILSNKDSILIFEEPEAHMFPPYVRKFTTDVIYNRDNQFFIATHSPYVLDAFLEDALDELAIYLVDYKEGESIVKLMSEKDISELRDFGVDIFFNMESYLKNGKINNA